MKRKLVTGDVYGQFTVVEAYARLGARRHWYHLSRCVCGVEEFLLEASLKKRTSEPCNHQEKIKPGDRFGRLTVIRKLTNQEGGRTKYECHCDCGNIKIVIGTYLKVGYVKSCGCLKTDSISQSHTIHGMEGTRMYRIWRNIKSRCLNKKSTQYKWYGARGITICEEWMSFEPFMKWAFANGYKNNLTIDREDNDGNYCPENCHWISQSENTAKQKNDRVVLRARQLAGA